MSIEAAGDGAIKKAADHSGTILRCLSLVLLVLATLFAYSPVGFDFFAGDDFVHLTWLANAINHHELIWRNFYTSWLDGTTTKFYRPLISVFMVSDYAIWGVNGLGFRLTNMAFHLASSIFIYLIVDRLQSTLNAANSREPAVQTPPATESEPLKESGNTTGGTTPSNSIDSISATAAAKSPLDSALWPIAAAALFALHPLHPEAVAWITGRVDSIVTAFCAASLFFYIEWRRKNKLPFMILCFMSMLLGLLSKEMAITLPAVFVWTEIFYGRKWQHAESSGGIVRWLIETARRSIQYTWPFWGLLVLYFVLRYFALGTFVGGYDDSLFFISNPKEFIRGWFHAIMMMLVPINRTLMGSHHWMSKAWPAAIIFLGLSSIATIACDRKNRTHFLFLSGWLAFCLIPVYKLFNIADDLQGSRLAYLATVPLCMMLTLGMASAAKLDLLKWWGPVRIAGLLFTLSLSTFLLWTNNQPWKQAGETSNKIRAELQNLFHEIPNDPQILFLGLPDQIGGAYTARNALDGMTKKPQLSRDIRNCLMVNAFEPILPFGFLKESIAEAKDQILIYRWDESSGKFKKVEIAQTTNPKVETWSGAELKRIITIPDQKEKPELNWTAAGATLKSGSKADYIALDLGARPSWSTDFVIARLALEMPTQSSQAMDLLYSNEMYPEFELRRRSHADFSPTKKEQTLIFAMRGLPEWSLGGNTGKFRLLLPSNHTITLKEIAVYPASYVTPLISFDRSGYLGTKGYLHLGKDQTEQKLSVSTRSVANASNLKVEITRANLLFEEQNPQKTSKVLWKEIPIEGKEGTLTLKFSDFRTPGIYEVRAWALDDGGTICGAGSDHIVLSVDPQ